MSYIKMKLVWAAAIISIAAALSLKDPDSDELSVANAVPLVVPARVVVPAQRYRPRNRGGAFLSWLCGGKSRVRVAGSRRVRVVDVAPASGYPADVIEAVAQWTLERPPAELESAVAVDPESAVEPVDPEIATAEAWRSACDQALPLTTYTVQDQSDENDEATEPRARVRHEIGPSGARHANGEAEVEAGQTTTQRFQAHLLRRALSAVASSRNRA